MSYILIVVFVTGHSFGTREVVTASEMKTKVACETAINAIKAENLGGVKRLKCVEVKP